MASRNPSYLLPPNWLDLVRATAWSAPDLPLLTSAPSPRPGDTESQKAAAHLPLATPLGPGGMPPEQPAGFAGAYSASPPFLRGDGGGARTDQLPGSSRAMSQGGMPHLSMPPASPPSLNEQSALQQYGSPQTAQQKEDQLTPEQRAQHCALDPATIAAEYANKFLPRLGQIDPQTNQRYTRESISRRAAEMPRMVEQIQKGCPSEMY